MGRYGVSNVVVVVSDALRADRVGAYSGGETTPFIDHMASRGVLFENAFSAINATDPSLTSIATGRYPSSHGIIHHGEHVTERELARVARARFLQEILREEGYLTIAVDFLGRWHRRGFEHYGAPPRSSGSLYQRARRLLPGPVRRLARRVLQSVGGQGAARSRPAFLYTAEEAVEYLLERLRRSRGRRFYALLHLWDTHLPYYAPAELLERFRSRYRGGIHDRELGELDGTIPRRRLEQLLRMYPPGTRLGDIVAAYDASAAYVDGAVRRLVEGLDDMGLMDETLVVFTSDHGESLTEHRIFFDHHGLYEVSIRVPLILYGADIPQGRRIAAMVQHVDLAPTILEMLGARERPYMEGSSLLPLLEDPGLAANPQAVRRLVYAEEAHTERKFAVRGRRYKYIMAASPEEAVCRYCGIVHGGVEELYDLSRDPGEEENIVEKEREVATILRHELERIRRRLLLGDSVKKALSRITRGRHEGGTGAG